MSNNYNAEIRREIRENLRLVRRAFSGNPCYSEVFDSYIGDRSQLVTRLRDTVESLAKNVKDHQDRERLGGFRNPLEVDYFFHSYLDDIIVILITHVFKEFNYKEESEVDKRIESLERELIKLKRARDEEKDA